MGILYTVGRMASIIEITIDNARLLGVGPADIGWVAIADGGSTTVVADMAAALDEIAARRGVPTAPEIGEVMQVGSGRQWMTVDD